MLLVIILYTVFRPQRMPELRIPFWGFTFIGFMIGLFGPLIGATGPMMAPFFLRSDLTKNQIVASKSAVQLIGHIIKLPAFYYLGFTFGEYTFPLTIMITGVILGTHFGVTLLGKISEDLFLCLFRLALLAAAGRLAYQLFTT